MALKCGIVGLPNVGKSTLFNCLSNARAQSANFPFCTIEPNVGIINVPDERLIKIQELVKPEKAVPTSMEIVDIAGLVKGASKGEGLGNQFLANIRETDAIIHILRCFEDENIAHVAETIDPIRDKEIIEVELQLKDLETVENRIQKIEKQAKTAGDKSSLKALSVLEEYKKTLQAGKNARNLQPDKESRDLVDDLFLLTNKRVLYVCNVDEQSLNASNPHVDKVKQAAAKEEDAEMITVAAKAEAEIAELESWEERQVFLGDLGLEESGVSRLIKSAYNLLGLKTFFTAGPKEVRAWTCIIGTKAPQAAGIIHSDFERGFIRAEVIKYEDFIRYGSEHACKEAGKMAVEGKEYMVEDGDIIHFRFNV